jgi:hypothetical protein
VAQIRRSIFEMAAVPAALGGTLEGKIQVRAKLQPQHGLHLRLSCVRRTTTGIGKTIRKRRKKFSGRTKNGCAPICRKRI